MSEETSHVLFSTDTGVHWAVNRETKAVLLDANALPASVAMIAMTAQKDLCYMDERLMLPVEDVIETVSGQDIKDGIRDKAELIRKLYEDSEEE